MNKLLDRNERDDKKGQKRTKEDVLQQLKELENVLTDDFETHNKE